MLTAVSRSIPDDIKKTNEITRDDYRKLVEEKGSFVLLDVRRDDERAKFNIGGKHIPVETLRAYNQAAQLEKQLLAAELTKDRMIVVYCRGGVRSYEATLMLQAIGFSKVKSLQGGMEGWQKDLDLSNVVEVTDGMAIGKKL